MLLLVLDNYFSHLGRPLVVLPRQSRRPRFSDKCSEIEEGRLLTRRTRSYPGRRRRWQHRITTKCGTFGYPTAGCRKRYAASLATLHSDKRHPPTDDAVHAQRPICSSRPLEPADGGIASGSRRREFQLRRRYGGDYGESDAEGKLSCKLGGKRRRTATRVRRQSLTVF